MNVRWNVRWLTASMVMATASCGAVSGAPPKGSSDTPEASEVAAMTAMGKKLQGTIVWSSSRMGNHDLFTMSTDGSNVKQITTGDAVDWFPRFSRDGSKILFARSKSGWVSERDANESSKWDIYTVSPDGSGAERVVENASWGSWVGADEIVFVRNTKVLRKKLGTTDETELLESSGVGDLDGALLQQPEMSHDGKYLAITLRGSKRETGVWDIEKKTWLKTGLGCQINWTPDGSAVYWVNPTGNGGSEIFRMPMKDGKPEKAFDDDQLRLMDFPGRRSHEYFPQMSADGHYMVWGITQRGHDHDIADYEIYLWQIGTPQDSAVRLTYHSGNDRWPDIFVPSAAPVAPAEAPPSPAPAAAAPSAGPAPALAPDAKPEPSATPKSKAHPKTGKHGKRSNKK